MKKILTLLLTVLMVATMGVVNASADGFYSDAQIGSFGNGWGLTFKNNNNYFTLQRGQNFEYNGEEVTLYKIVNHFEPSHSAVDATTWPNDLGNEHTSDGVYDYRLQYSLSKDGGAYSSWTDVPNDGNIKVTAAGEYKIKFQYAYEVYDYESDSSIAQTISMNANVGITDVTTSLNKKTVVMPTYDVRHGSVAEKQIFDGNEHTLIKLQDVATATSIKEGLNINYELLIGNTKVAPVDNQKGHWYTADDTVKYSEAYTGNDLVLDDADYYTVRVIASLKDNYKWPGASNTQALSGWTQGTGNYAGKYYRDYKAYIDRAPVLPTMSLTNADSTYSLANSTVKNDANDTLNETYNHNAYTLAASGYNFTSSNGFAYTSFTGKVNSVDANDYDVVRTNVGSDTLVLTTNSNFYFGNIFTTNSQRKSTLTYTLNVGKLTVNPVTVANKTGLVFDNTNHALVTTTIPTNDGGTDNNGVTKIEYSVVYNGGTPSTFTAGEGSHALTAVPTGYNAGTYEVTAKVFYDSNHTLQDGLDSDNAKTLPTVTTVIEQLDLVSSVGYKNLGHNFCDLEVAVADLLKTVDFKVTETANSKIEVDLDNTFVTDATYKRDYDLLVKVDGTEKALTDKVALHHGTHTISVEVKFKDHSAVDNNLKSYLGDNKIVTTLKIANPYIPSSPSNPEPLPALKPAPNTGA